MSLAAGVSRQHDTHRPHVMAPAFVGQTVERARYMDPDAITFAHVSQGQTSSAVDIALS